MRQMTPRVSQMTRQICPMTPEASQMLLEWNIPTSLHCRRFETKLNPGLRAQDVWLNEASGGWGPSLPPYTRLVPTHGTDVPKPPVPLPQRQVKHPTSGTCPNAANHSRAYNIADICSAVFSHAHFFLQFHMYPQHDHSVPTDSGDLTLPHQVKQLC